MRGLFFAYLALTLAFIPAAVVSQNPPPVYLDTLSEDGDGHKKGDVRITLPPNAAALLNDAISKLGGHNQCYNFQLRARDPVNLRDQQARVAAIVQSILPLAIPGTLINAFGLQNQIAIPRYRDVIVQAQITAVQGWASCQAAFAMIDIELLNSLIYLIYITVLDFCEFVHDVQTVIWLLSSQIEMNQNVDNDDHCPARKSESPICQECNGNDNNRCTTGSYTDCTCIGTAVVFTQPGTRRDLEAAQRVMAEMIGQDYPSVKKVDSGDLQCGTAYDQGNANWFATLQTMDRAAAFFCKRLGDDKIKFDAGKAADHYVLHYNNHHWDPIYVSVDWHPGDPGSQPLDFSTADAQKTCNDRLGAIINGCDTAKNDKLYWKQGGTFYRGGMKWYINRDTWAKGDVPSDPTWDPRVVTCQEDSDCNHTPWPCQGTCQKDAAYSDMGYCPCGSGL